MPCKHFVVDRTLLMHCNIKTLMVSTNRTEALAKSSIGSSPSSAGSWVQLLPCLGPTDPLVHYNRVFDVVRVVGSQQRALAFLAGIDFDEPHCCVATLNCHLHRWGRNMLEYFYTVSPQKGFFTCLGSGRPNECCSHSDEIWTTIFFF